MPVRSAMAATLRPERIALPDPMRAAVRFPLRLPATLHAGAEQVAAHTVDVSSVGVLFELEGFLDAGTVVRWELCLPADCMGNATDITVDCAGRVAWMRAGSPNRMAVMIDEYHLRESSK